MSFRCATCGARDGNRGCVDCGGDERTAELAPVQFDLGPLGAAGAGSLSGAQR